MSEPTQFAGRLAAVQARIETACAEVGRDPGGVTLVAVAKKHSVDRVREALACGVTDIGENYVQELLAKADALQGDAVRWHFIGKLQRNKVNKIVGRAVLLHAVDSVALAQTIDRRARDLGITQDVLLAVNVGGESQKSGVPPERAAELLAEWQALEGVCCRGLMTMPPPAEPAVVQGLFGSLRELRDRLAERFPTVTELSMGMTSDLEPAVREGATWVRVGTALFGPRPSPEVG